VRRKTKSALRSSKKQLDHEIAAALQRHVPNEHAQEAWLEDQIRQAALRIAGGFDRRVRLTDLRRFISEAGRDELDQALRRMSSQGKIALFPLDDPTEKRLQDIRDALDLSGVPQHVLYLPSRGTLA
jgi:hypothetical protein